MLVRRATTIAVLVLASILLGALAAGTPVAGNDTIAARTAGIELGTSVVARTAPGASSEAPAPRPLVAIVLAALVGWAAAIRPVRRRCAAATSAPTRPFASGPARRGPPAPA
jgi:hypothetical protein